MTAATSHDVKTAAAVLADDVICQSFIQSSSTLAYACLLIRRKRYELAAHVLHSLEAKQASRFKDMVFYLQAQIGIETGEFAVVKKRLVPRVHQHPNDMVALSLLECSIYLEFLEWEKSHPQAAFSGSASEPDEPPVPGFSAAQVVSDSVFGNAQAAYAAAQAAAYEEPSAAPASPGPAVFAASAASDSPASVYPGAPESPVSLESLIEIAPPAPAAKAARAAEPARPAAPAQASAPRVQYASSPGSDKEGDFGVYQSLVNDANTQALALWNPDKGRVKSACRNPSLETLVAMLPHEVPASIQSACASLDGGMVNKICFSFQHLTVTSFHSGSENMGLITGNINQTLLSIVRAENTFRKQAASRPVEYAPNE
jgi:hypothetical protein